MGMLRPWRGLASLKSSSRGVASPLGISFPCVGTSSGEKGGGRGVACSAFWTVSSSSSRGVTRAEAPLNLRSRAAFCEGDAILVTFVKRARRGAAHGCPSECSGPRPSIRRLDRAVGLRSRRNASSPTDRWPGSGFGRSGFWQPSRRPVWRCSHVRWSNGSPLSETVQKSARGRCDWREFGAAPATAAPRRSEPWPT